MRAFLLRGLVYIPAYLVGHLAIPLIGEFNAGWMAAGAAVLITVLIWPPPKGANA